MDFHTRKWIRPEDLNPHGILFGGSLLRWIDEETAIYAVIQLDNTNIVTKYISEIDFVSSAGQGDIIELDISQTRLGRTSLTMRCDVRNMFSHKSILTIEKLVVVSVDANGNPKPHGKTEVQHDIAGHPG
jgi:acyl-CoA hydrolase